VLVTDHRDDGLRKTPWLELLGPEYLETAFSAAAAADPGAMLVYNDYGLDSDDAVQQAKRLAVLAHLRRLKRNGIPLHAFGMQAHLAGDSRQFRPEVLKRSFGEVSQLGLKILITELDVTDTRLSEDIVTRDREVAQVYKAYLSVALEEPAVVAILTWGLSDRYTWHRRKDGGAVRPLPLDRELGRKPAWQAVATALDAAAQRP
jgi:endo-1,4-beta-xylanase